MVLNVTEQYGGPSFNRPSICRRPGSHTCFVFFPPFVSLEMSLFRAFFVPSPFSLCMESTPYVLSFRMVFFYLVTTGWIIDISLCKNSYIKNIITTVGFSPILYS